MANALRKLVAILAATSALSCASALPAAAAPAYQDNFSPRVRKLLSELTLDEKLALNSGAKEPVYGGQAGYSRGVPRLGIPSMRWADGGNGINSAYDGTALPSGLALAATFDPELAYDTGRLLGAEARAMKVDVVLAPFVNLARLPNAAGAFGEDPFLAGQEAAAMVRGIQSQGALTMTQQYLANVQFLHQGGGADAAEGYDFIVDDRTLHEIYLAPFEASIKAGTTSIMAAYNKVNGEYNALNARNLTGILRDELGFTGWANSDWHANRATVSITRGLDVEMPGAGPMDPEGYPPQFEGKLKAAIQSGQIPAADLNRAVGRLLSAMERFGMLDGTRKPTPVAIDEVGDAAVARRVAAESEVLLKNDGALPLSPKALGSLAVIGPNARQVPGAGGNRAYGFPDRLTPALDALKRTAPDAQITYAVGDPLSGVAIPASALSPAEGGGRGLSRDALDGTTPVVEVLDHTRDPLPPGHGYRWTGILRAPAAGAYTLEIASWGGSATLKLDGKTLGASAKLSFAHGVPRRWTSVVPTLDNLDHALATVQLEPGRTYAVEVDAQAEQMQTMQVRLGWITPAMRAEALDEAVRAARAAKTALVFVWNGRGGDQNVTEQSFALPNGQDALVEAVAAANPNTVVVMNTATSVALPWRDKVKAIVAAWNPGQEGAWATADILLGRISPSGRLPVTWPDKPSDTAALDPRHPERYQGDPATKQVVFSEGVFMGYRWFDANAITPAYPFGHGLSYTRFDYADLKAHPEGDGAQVSFTVRNIGRMAADEVAQVYLGSPSPSAVPEPPQRLSGFQRVHLAPGEARRITVTVPARQFQYWSEPEQRWVRQGGARPVMVGASSRDIRLRAVVALPAQDRAIPAAETAGAIGARTMITGRVGARAGAR